MACLSATFYFLLSTLYFLLYIKRCGVPLGNFLLSTFYFILYTFYFIIYIKKCGVPLGNGAVGQLSARQSIKYTVYSINYQVKLKDITW